MAKSSKRTRLAYVTVAALSSTFMSSEALADCISQAPVDALAVICGGIGANGWNGASTNGLKVTVNAGATVTNNVGGPALISTGTGSSVINFSGAFNNGVGSTYGIDAGSKTNPALSMGGGSQFTNNSNANMRGAVSFGSATGSAVNVLNNNYSHSGSTNLIGVIDGNISSVGNTTINNQGFMGWNYNIGITQTGAGTVIINNGVAGGYASPVVGLYTYQNGFIENIGGTAISTVGNTTLTNYGGGNGIGALIWGDVNLGTGGTGTSSIVNGSQADGNATIQGNVTMSDKDNVITNDGTITGNVTMNGTGSNTYNAGSAGSSGDNGLRLPGSAVNGGTGLPTGIVTGTLQGKVGNEANNTLNLNGTGASTLQVGSTINNFGVVNKNNSGTWVIKNTLDGAAGKLTTVNVTGGKLSLDKANFLGSAATTVKLSNSTTLEFNGTTTGTFAGNIVDATGATSGTVLVTGANTTTLSGTNSYSGGTVINGGTLATGSNGALSANSNFFIGGGGQLIVNNQNTIKSLTDSGAATVNLNGAGTSLTLGSGAWGLLGGTITGNGSLIKTSGGLLTLDGTNAVNLSGGGTFFINSGTVNVNAVNAIGANTIVQMNPGNSPVLNINQNDTIGGLGGLAGSTVNIASGKKLTSGAAVSIARFDGNIHGAGSLEATGAGSIMFLNGVNDYSGGTTVSGTAELWGWAGPSGNSLQGNIAAGAGTLVLFNQANTPAGSVSGTYAGQLSGAGQVSFKGDGTTLLTLTGNNSGLTGQMNFLSGTVGIGAANNLGVGTLAFNGGTLRNTASLTLANAITTTSAGGATLFTDPGTSLSLNGNITGNGALTKIGSGTLILQGTNTYSGGTNVNNGKLVGQAGTGLQGNIAVSSLGTVNFIGTGTYAGNLSGQGQVQISSVATTFTGTNTYSGSTVIDSGATLTAGLNHLSANSAHIVEGTLTLTGNNSIKGLGSGGSTGVVNFGGNTLTLAGLDDTVYRGHLNGAGALVVNNGGGTWTFRGVTDTPLTSFTNNGTTYLIGSLAATTGTNASGATLYGNGTFTGAFTNNGTIKPGFSPGVLNFVGSYAQGASGTYVIDINANNSASVVAGTDYDQIAVTGTPGTANLAGNATINQNGGQFVNGTVYTILKTTASTTGASDGLITGSFNFTNNVISPFITLTPSIVNNAVTHSAAYNLTVVRSNYRTVANNPNQAAVAGLTSTTGLQGLVGLSSANAAIARIDNMSASDARTLFDQISPEAYGAYVTALQDQGNLFTRQVAHRMAQTTSEKDAKMGVWGSLYGQWGNGKNKSFRFGSDEDIKGGALGVDGTMSGNLTLGAAVGYSEAKVDYNLGNSKGKSKSWQVGGYASYHPGKVVADLQLAYVHGKVSASKGVSVGSGFSATSGSASASTSGSAFKVIGTVGYEVGSDTLGFRPFVGVDFTSGNLKGFNEHGTLGPLLLGVRKQELDRTDLLVGFKFAPQMGSLQPYADATLRYGMKRNNGLVRAFFNGISSDQFTVSAQRAAKMQGELDAGVAYGIGKNASIFFGYEGTLRKSLTEHGVNGGIKLAF